MATKKTPKRKTAKKSGARKKKVAKKTRSRTPSGSGASRARKTAKKKSAPRKKAKKKVAKKKATRKKASKKTAKKKATRRKPTKAERKATHGTRRKPFTGGREAKREILNFFGSDDLSDLTPKELEERKLAFLRAYANRGIVRDGCIAGDISWSTYTRWRENDEPFNQACKHAEQLAGDRLEAEAHRRAFDGFDRPVIYQGEITDTYTDYSEGLMRDLLRGYKKDKYKDRKEHSTPPGQPMQLEAETKDSVVSSILGMIANKPDPED